MLFAIVKDPNLTARDLDQDLINIQNWAHQWKMSFNPDPKMQAVEMLFSHKNTSNIHHYTLMVPRYAKLTSTNI